MKCSQWNAVSVLADAWFMWEKMNVPYKTCTIYILLRYSLISSCHLFFIYRLRLYICLKELNGIIWLRILDHQRWQWWWLWQNVLPPGTSLTCFCQLTTFSKKCSSPTSRENVWFTFYRLSFQMLAV